jgi:hypothetical protein
MSCSYTIRLTADEARSLRDACTRQDVGLSALVQAAVVDAAHRLGFFAGVTTVPVRAALDTLRICRRARPKTERSCISVNPLTNRLLRRTASHLGLSASHFIVTATLDYIAISRQAEPAWFTSGAHPAVSRDE